MEKVSEEMKEVKMKMDRSASVTSGMNLVMQEEIKLIDANQGVIIPHNMYTFNIIFIGSSGVGKSSIIKTILGEKLGKISPTLGCDKRNKKFKIDEKLINLKIYDLGDVDLSVNMQVVIDYINISHSCVYVADVNNSSTLNIIEKILNNKSVSSNHLNYILLNKSDVNKNNRDESLVTSKVNSYTKTHNFTLKKIVHTSIKEKDTIQTTFNNILLDLIEYYERPEKRIVYADKNKRDDTNFFFKYKIKKSKKGCYYC